MLFEIARTLKGKLALHAGAALDRASPRLMQSQNKPRRNLILKKRTIPDLLVSLLLPATALALCFLIVRRYLAGISPDNISPDGLLIRPIYDKDGVLAELRLLTPLFLADAAAVLAAVLFRLFGKKKAPWFLNAPGARKPIPAAENMGPASRHTAWQRVLRLALLAAAVIFLILGVKNGGLRDVLIKAINICTECIGLG